MKRLVVCTAVALAMVGCAPMYWDKAGVSPQDNKADMISCDRVARAETNSGGSFGHTHLRVETFKKCMIDRGYTQRP